MVESIHRFNVLDVSRGRRGRNGGENSLEHYGKRAGHLDDSDCCYILYANSDDIDEKGETNADC